MNKERYRFSPNFEEVSDFENFVPAEMDIDAQKSIFETSAKGYDIELIPNYISEGVVTINLRYDAERNYNIHNSVRLADNSSLRLVIFHHSTSNAKIKESMTIHLGRNSRLKLVEVVDTHSTVLSNIQVVAEADSKLEITTLDLNNQYVVRNQTVELIEPGAECTLNGLYITGSAEHVDNYINVRHLAPHCTSNQQYKGVLSGESTAAFTGYIFVAKDAQKTLAYQQNHNIVLSDRAKINTRPQLEIYADDVKCNHGATVGRLDPDALYYMRQRGIPIDAARRLQLTGFAEDVVKIEDFGDIQAIVNQKIVHKLERI